MAKTKILGEVVSKSEKTVGVLNTYKTKHPKYQKIIKRTKKYLADNQLQGVEIGSVVEIEETTPISKKKNFKVIRVVK
jgi:small subunit ribosomal protein S17